jgi:hypothetical protein
MKPPNFDEVVCLLARVSEVAKVRRLSYDNSQKQKHHFLQRTDKPDKFDILTRS